MRQTEFFMGACDPKTLTVGQLMQDAVFSCGPRTTASTLAHLMTHRNFGSLPVVESDGTLVGIVSEYDLLQAMIEGRDLRKILATEIMSAHPVSVTEDQTLAQVRTELDASRAELIALLESIAPEQLVLCGEHPLSGAVSLSDLLVIIYSHERTHANEISLKYRESKK